MKPKTNESSAVTNTATLPHVNGNGNAPPNNGGPPDRNGFEAPDPVTGSEIFQEIWAINGPFEEPWMSAFNASVWLSDQTWRNDATGHGFDTSEISRIELNGHTVDPRIIKTLRGLEAERQAKDELLSVTDSLTAFVRPAAMAPLGSDARGGDSEAGPVPFASLWMDGTA